MTTTHLKTHVSTFSSLSKVSEQLMDWNLEPVVGKGLYNKHDSIAYVEMRMYKNTSEGYAGSWVIWNANTAQLDEWHPVYKSDIEEGLLFFIRHLSVLRPEVANLTFEINDLAFDQTATRHNPFKGAVVGALVNCFDKEPLGLIKEQLVRTLKEIWG